MGMRRALLVAGLGVAVGYLAKQQIDQYQKITPEKALENAKEMFKKQGSISGSWIYMKPEEMEKDGLLYTVYRGGITREADGENKQYEFHVDVDTGAVIGAVQTA
ncbi:PepSY domain-containing protein [Oceanobacillus halotolerans]|uniref:PepSY domain-containing protein n=1 Tax=Oceanobacillus halotolerans TaxID=2663380 RepID=UPI0013DB1FC0|nr:PepSY domain-containing protein [Oceanobacillus halotolerans]